LKERIERRIAELTAERDNFVTSANQRIAAYNGGIAELKSLLEAEAMSGEVASPETPEVPDADATGGE